MSSLYAARMPTTSAQRCNAQLYQQHIGSRTLLIQQVTLEEIALTRNEQRRPGGGGAASDLKGKLVGEYSSLRAARHPSHAASDLAAEWLIQHHGVRPVLAGVVAEMAMLGGGER